MYINILGRHNQQQGVEQQPAGQYAPEANQMQQQQQQNKCQFENEKFIQVCEYEGREDNFY